MAEPAVERVEVGIADRQQGQVDDVRRLAGLASGRLHADFLDQGLGVHAAVRVGGRRQVGLRGLPHGVGQRCRDGAGFQAINDHRAVVGHFQHAPDAGKRRFLHPPMLGCGGEGADFAKTQRLVDDVAQRGVEIAQVQRGAAGKAGLLGLIDVGAEQFGRPVDHLGRHVVGQARLREGFHALGHGQVIRRFLALRAGAHGDDGNREGTQRRRVHAQAPCEVSARTGMPIGLG